jgi:hypothetical protein
MEERPHTVRRNHDSASFPSNEREHLANLMVDGAVNLFYSVGKPKRDGLLVTRMRLVGATPEVVSDTMGR